MSCPTPPSPPPTLRDYGLTEEEYQVYLHYKNKTNRTNEKNRTLSFGDTWKGKILGFLRFWRSDTVPYSFNYSLLYEEYCLPYEEYCLRYEEARVTYDWDRWDDYLNRQVAKRRQRKEAKRASFRKKVGYWQSLKAVRLEKECASLFARQDYLVTDTPPSGDEGIDLILEKDGKKTVVQCKGYEDPAGPNIVRELFGSMHHFKADSAILVCTGGFTRGVWDFVKGKPIRLMSAKTLAQESGGQ